MYINHATNNKHIFLTAIFSLHIGSSVERPSKKDGFCFKLFHPMDQSIWASKGPEVSI